MDTRATNIAKRILEEHEQTVCGHEERMVILAQAYLNPWISVDERLPEYTAHAGPEEFVHVIGAHELGVSEVMYCNEKWFYNTGIEVNVTKWTPLPKE